MIDYRRKYDDQKTVQAVLDRIASVIGCSTEDFSDEQFDERAQVLELLSLWLETDDRQGRAKALAYLKGIATGVTLRRSEARPGESQRG